MSVTKTALVAVVFLVLFTIGDSMARAQEHVQTNWGMKRDQIVELMNEEPTVEKRDMIVYQGIPMGNMITTAGFIFNRRDRLVQKTYIFNLSYEEPLQYVMDKLTIKNQLDNLYGKMESNVKWHDFKYINDSERLGEAVVNGGVEIVTVWYDTNSTIVLSLRGGDGDARLVLDFLRK